MEEGFVFNRLVVFRPATLLVVTMDTRIKKDQA